MVMRPVLFILKEAVNAWKKTVLRKVVGNKRDKQSDTLGVEGIT